MQNSNNNFIAKCWDLLDFIYCSFSDFFFYNFLSKNSSTFNPFNANWDPYYYDVYLNFFFSFIKSELFISLLFDNLILNLLFFLEYSDFQFRKVIGFLEPTLFSIYHPETVFINKNLKSNVFFVSGGHISVVIFDKLDKYSQLQAINYYIQMFILCFFIITYCTYYCSFFYKNKSELQIEAEFLFSSLSFEAEKELFSVDDAVHCVFFLTFMFGIYFGFLFLALDLTFAEISLFFVPLFLIFIFIFFIPVNLLYDFGLFFITYLRGASNTSSLFFECIYDYIGLIAFFTRLLVQFVRLILMFVVYCIMHDAVMLQNYSSQSFFISDSFWDDFFNIFINSDEMFYFFFTAFPIHIMYWLYECLHTFFVVTVQFSAFFTIIFWLFLLFYTFFVYEKYEHHFNNLNKIHNNLIFELKKLKK